MRLRLKFLDRFHTYESPSTDSLLSELLESASRLFALRRDNVQISLNAKDFYDSSNSHLSLSQIGVVSGDIIYVRSLEKLDDIKQSLEAELAAPIFRLANELISSQQYSSIYFLAIPLYVFAIEKGLNSVDSINQYFQKPSSIIRLPFTYRKVSPKVVFTIFQNGNIISIAASVQGLPIRKQLLLQTKDYVIDQNLIDQSVANKSILLYRQLRPLAVRIKDELIEPVLLALHSEFILPPRIHLCNLPNELFCQILSSLPLRALGSLMFCNHQLYNRIRGCSTIWRIHLANIDAKKKLVLDAALSRQQRQLKQLQDQQQRYEQQHTSNDENQEDRNEFGSIVNKESVSVVNDKASSTSPSTPNDSDYTIINQPREYEAYERFLARQKCLSMQRRNCRISRNFT
ncbi:unnamed protein product [Heterobilharzia americana]|nr:unnamed protein product [Heterobilharzia americana]